jgi:YD repeat-containing protein
MNCRGCGVELDPSQEQINTAVDQIGATVEMRDAKGNRLELKRDSQRNLQEIRTPHGHWIRFGYDDLSRITRAEDDADGVPLVVGG